MFRSRSKGERQFLSPGGFRRTSSPRRMAAYVGLDPNKDIKWVTRPFAESMRLLAEGKIDGFMGFPPEPQELRANKIGHVMSTRSGTGLGRGISVA